MKKMKTLNPKNSPSSSFLNSPLCQWSFIWFGDAMQNENWSLRGSFKIIRPNDAENAKILKQAVDVIVDKSSKVKLKAGVSIKEVEDVDRRKKWLG